MVGILFLYIVFALLAVGAIAVSAVLMRQEEARSRLLPE